MEPDHLLSRLINSVETTFIRSGRTEINPSSKPLLMATLCQPLTLVTQITDGPLLFTVGHNTMRIEPGQALIVPPNIQYTLKLVNGQETVTNWLNLNYTVFQHFSIFDFFDTPFITSHEIGSKIGKLQAHFVGGSDEEALDQEALLVWAVERKQALFTVLSMLLSISRFIEGSSDKLKKVKRFEKVFAYIEEHLADKIKIPQLAQLMFISTSKFHKQFQEAFDISPLQYIRMERLKKAQYLLATTDMTINQIADQVGYDSAFTLIRFFKSMYGASPGHYRKVVMNSL